MKISTENVNDSQLVLGIPGKSVNHDIINFVLLKSRFYIYRQRLFHKCELEIMQWLFKLKRSLLSEEYICKMDNKSKAFEKWQRFLDVL